MNRAHQSQLIGATLIAAWVGMQAVHEAGHVLAAALTGGTVTNVALHPWGISRTDVGENPRPLVVVWAGPMVGVVAPLALWGIFWLGKLPGAFLLRFIAGFCLIANGCYLAFGSLAAIGDCGEMLRHGSSMWTLWVFGAATIPVGFLLWNGQGKHFGLGRNPLPIDRRVAWGMMVVAVGLLVMGFVVGD